MTDTTTSDLEARGDEPRSPRSRRRFLVAGGVLAAGAVAAACSDDGPTGTSTGATTGPTTTGAAGGPTPTTTGGGALSGDLATAAFAASLEQLAVDTYQAAAEAAGAGALGEVPPAVVEFVTVALGQHQDALDAWNAVLSGAGEAEVTTPPADLQATVAEAFGSVTDAGGAAELALMLEQVASNTYLAAMPTLVDPAAITLAGQLQYVDQMHAAVLLFALGRYPVPEIFQSTDLAAAPG